MSCFIETYKKFDKLRDYTRDFLIFGYKTRNNFNIKSKRTYDNEKRRIESILKDNIKSATGTNGKRTYISIDPEEMNSNPLFSLWETKHFTSNDCFLHFIIIEIIRSHGPIFIEKIAEIILEIYEIDIDLDIMTIRNKANELVSLGYLSSIKNGRQLLYMYSIDPIMKLDKCEIQDLYNALEFFSMVKPFGEVGRFINSKFEIKHDLIKEIILHKNYFMYHTLDDIILLDVLNGIKNKKKMRFSCLDKAGEENLIFKGVPLKVVTNSRHGRRYIIIHNDKTNDFTNIRIDRIKSVKELNSCLDFEELLSKLSASSNTAWGISYNQSNELEKLTIKLQINEINEIHILNRIRLEGKHGSLTHIGQNKFQYEIEVNDTYEMLPWIRTFMGRIIDIYGTNTKAINMFLNDINTLYDIYNINESDGGY